MSSEKTPPATSNGRARLVETAEPSRRYTNGVLLRRMFLEARPYWAKMGLLFVLSLLAAPLFLLTPLPLKIAVDSVVGSQPLPGFLDAVLPDALARSETGLLLFAAAFQVLVVLLAQVQSLGSYVLQTQVGEGLTLAFRARIFAHLQRLSLAFHDQRGPADSMYRIQWDAPAIQWIMVSGLIPFVSAVVLLVATVYVIASIDWVLALVAVAVAPLLVLLSRAYDKRLRPKYLELHGLDTSALGVIQESLGAFRVVKAFGREDREEKRFARRSGESFRARIHLSLFEGGYQLMVNVITAVGAAMVLFFGFLRVLSGDLTIGDIILIVAYLVQLYAPMSDMSQQVAAMQTALASAERSFEVLDEPTEVSERADALPIQRAAGAIELRDVSFSYDSRNPVLHDVSLSVEPGARVGIAGRTGAGKTTLVNLLARFYDPDSGQILLDGVDLRDYRVADLRRQLGIVLQEPVLFSTTIAENISYARPEASYEEIVDAARAANAHDFVLGSPNGYDTVVGERGMRLSGGERQRISLARAFLKDAPILILDEPTSSVDTRTEATIMEAMERLMSGRTTLMIAHRLATLEHCDVRIEVEDGRVISPVAL